MSGVGCITGSRKIVRLVQKGLRIQSLFTKKLFLRCLLKCQALLTKVVIKTLMTDLDFLTTLTLSGRIASTVITLIWMSLAELRDQQSFH
jgi:hypothetical protein